MQGIETYLTDDEINVLKRAGVIAAIRAVRLRTGCGLLEAKDTVDRYRATDAPRDSNRDRLIIAAGAGIELKHAIDLLGAAYTKLAALGIITRPVLDHVHGARVDAMSALAELNTATKRIP